MVSVAIFGRRDDVDDARRKPSAPEAAYGDESTSCAASGGALGREKVDAVGSKSRGTSPTS